MDGCSKAPRSLLRPTGWLWQLCRQFTESGRSHRCHLTPWPTVSQFHSSSFQTVRWMASHFDDLFKQFVRSTTSCKHMIQNTNVCCRCNFSCQLCTERKWPLFQRDAISLQMLTRNALVKQSAGADKNSNNNNANISFKWIAKWLGGLYHFLITTLHRNLRLFA